MATKPKRKPAKTAAEQEKTVAAAAEPEAEAPPQLRGVRARLQRRRDEAAARK